MRLEFTMMNFLFMILLELRIVSLLSDSNIINLKIYSQETPTQVFSCEHCEILRTPFFTEHFLWLLLYLITGKSNKSIFFFSYKSVFVIFSWRDWFQIFTCQFLANIYLFNSFMTETVIIQKPAHWFALQINGLVSLW